MAWQELGMSFLGSIWTLKTRFYVFMEHMIQFKQLFYIYSFGPIIPFLN